MVQEIFLSRGVAEISMIGMHLAVFQVDQENQAPGRQQGAGE